MTSRAQRTEGSTDRAVGGLEARDWLLLCVNAELKQEWANFA